jgi:hypothetical protein
VDVAKGEMVEKDLDAMIERHSLRKDPDEEHGLWRGSVRQYNARRQKENRLAWCEYFMCLAACLRARAEEYDRRARRLMESKREGTA